SQAGRAISSSRNHCVDSWRTVGVVALAQIQPPHSRWIIQASARTSVVHFLFVETTFCENARDCLPRRSVVEEGRSRRFKTPHYRGQSQSPPAHRRRLQTSNICFGSWRSGRLFVYHYIAENRLLQFLQRAISEGRVALG